MASAWGMMMGSTASGGRENDCMVTEDIQFVTLFLK
jgi:hypothetical protein